MAKINESHNNLYRTYMIGFFVMLALPLLNIPPWFTPPSYTQAIIFRSLLAILGFVYLVKEKTIFSKIKEALSPHSKVFLPLITLLGYFLTVFISTIFSIDASNSLWGTPLRGAGFINFAFFILFCFLSFLIIKKEDWKKLLDFSLFIGFLVGLVAIFQQFGMFRSFFAFMPVRPSSTMGNTIILALYLLPLLFLSLSFSIMEKDRKKRYLYLFLTFFYSFIIIFLTQTRAAILGLLVGFFWFLIAYPKKLKILKISAIILPILFIIFIFFLSANPQIYENWQGLLKDGALRMTAVTHGLSSEQSRISAWRISISAFFEKPFFGYGPENFYVAFNKYYDPNLPAMGDTKDFDRAHNYLIQTLIDSGIFALIFYLIFLLLLLWNLQKIKKVWAVSHGLQAGFIAFFVASLASIDGFAIMLIFFFFSAYSLSLSSNLNEKIQEISVKESKFRFIRTPALYILALILVIFLWQYNFAPLQMNKQIVMAQELATENWQDALRILDGQSKIKTFFLPYTNSIFLNMIVSRVIAHPEDNASLSEKARQISQKNTELEPYNYRNWLRLGESLATIAKEDKNPETIKKSNDAFAKALELSPKNTSILLSHFMANISLNDFDGAKEKSAYCLKTFPENRECLWMSALINIYLGDIKTGKEFIEKAKTNSYATENEIALRQLVAAYLKTKNYKEMLPLYQKLAQINTSEIQYRTSLMIIYKELGDYNMARQIAQEIIKTNPELKIQVEEFLRTF